MAQEIPDGIVMEPVFVIEATYGPDAAELRPPHRPTHLARIAALRAAGVVVEREGSRTCRARCWWSEPPTPTPLLRSPGRTCYMREGVWVEVRVRPFVRVARPDEIPA